MKKLLILLVVALLMMSVNSYARVGDARIGTIRLESMSIGTNNHVHVSTSPVAVYRVTVTADLAATAFQMINSSGDEAATNEADVVRNAISPSTYGDNPSTSDVFMRNVKADLVVTTANSTTIFNFAENGGPLRFDAGLLCGFAKSSSAATAVIEYTSLEN